MIATVAQTQAELPRLLEVVGRGEDVLIMVEGQLKARLTRATIQHQPFSEAENQKWKDELTRRRARLFTGKMTPTVEEILEEDRSDRA